METAYTSLSPAKKSNFRSKTKSKDPTSTFYQTINTNNNNKVPQQKVLHPFYNYVKQFPIETAEDVLILVKNFEPIHKHFLENLQNVKLYKNQLGCEFEENWYDFLMFLKSVVVKMNKRADKIIDDKEKKILQLLKINKQLQNERKHWMDKIEKLQSLREFQNGQLAMADNQLEIVNREMTDIYKILQSDMSKVMLYLTTLEAKKAKQDEEGSNQIYSSLNSLSLLLNNMQMEQKEAGTTLSTMRELIKAMARSTKATTGTQVDQSQLQTKAGSIFSNNASESILPFEIADGVSVNITGKNQPNHVIDKLKEKQKIHAHEHFKLQKHAEKPWALTPTLLTFLQNMSKQNQSGKVLPWQYMKQLINEIYQERGKFEGEMTAGNIGNGMLFDEFVVFYFLNKHKIRRLTEVKLLEFIISLKYYCKFWVKAQLFCYLMDVMSFNPLFDKVDSFNYKFDYNTQNFYFSVYKKLASYEQVVDDGMVYISTKNVRKLIKVALFFTDQINKSRLIVKIQKDLRVFDKVQYCDFDYALLLLMDEYLAAKKKINNILNKSFSKKFDQNQGYFSIDELLELFTDTQHIYRGGVDFPQKYPIDSKLQIGKLYLYAITSGKNDYEINGIHFIQACQRFGFDSPYPFLHACPKKKLKEATSVQLTHLDRNQEFRSEEFKPQVYSKQNIQNKQEQEFPKTESERLKAETLPTNNLNTQRIDVGAKLFSQHFSLLRELKSYVDIFTKTLREEKDAAILWKSFQQISKILEKGCHFMKYPLVKCE